MDQTTIISHWEDRAKKAGVTVGQLCGVAGVAPSTFSRWKAGTSILFATANKIEAALLEIEAREPSEVGGRVVHPAADTPTEEANQSGKSEGVTAQAEHAVSDGDAIPPSGASAGEALSLACRGAA